MFWPGKNGDLMGCFFGMAAEKRADGDPIGIDPTSPNNFESQHCLTELTADLATITLSNQAVDWQGALP